MKKIINQEIKKRGKEQREMKELHEVLQEKQPDQSKTRADWENNDCMSSTWFATDNFSVVSPFSKI